MRTVEIKSMTAPVGPSFSSRLPGADPIRLAIVAAVAIVLALSAAITMAASPSPQAGGSSRTVPAGSPAPNRRGPSSGFGAFGSGLGPSVAGPGSARGFGFHSWAGGAGGFGALGGATVASIDGSKLALRTADGWTRTISVTSSTKITRGGQAIALAELKVGDTIAFRETKASDGSFTIDAISVVLPQVFGQVTATTSDTITIKQFNGTTATIHVGSSITLRVLGVAKATIASLKVGMTISADGTKAADGSLDALNVSGGQFRMPLPGGVHKTPGGNSRPAGPSATSAPGA
jgi:hypothetical protein